MQKYRNNGAIGALLDEYKKAIFELKMLLNKVSTPQLKAIVDLETKDPDCKSIQMILTHVVRAGLRYVVYIRKNLGEDIDFQKGETLTSIAVYQMALDKVFQKK
ncbi:MAG: hypothetical protein ACI9XO_004363 [Paraglaciecola sp.]|jgi:hypothetical protein